MRLSAAADLIAFIASTCIILNALFDSSSTLSSLDHNLHIFVSGAQTGKVKVVYFSPERCLVSE